MLAGAGPAASALRADVPDLMQETSENRIAPLRIAADHAHLALPEAKRGMGANFGSIVMPRLLPRAVAFRMLYTGEPLGADEALRWGLVTHVVPKGQGLAKAHEIAETIAANGPLSVAATKASCKQCHDLYKEKYKKELPTRPFP